MIILAILPPESSTGQAKAPISLLAKARKMRQRLSSWTSILPVLTRIHTTGFSESQRKARMSVFPFLCLFPTIPHQKNLKGSLPPCNEFSDIKRTTPFTEMVPCSIDGTSQTLKRIYSGIWKKSRAGRKKGQHMAAWIHLGIIILGTIAGNMIARLFDRKRRK